MHKEFARLRGRVLQREVIVFATIYCLYGAIFVPFLLASATNRGLFLAIAIGAPLIQFIVFYWTMPLFISLFTRIKWTGDSVLPEESRNLLRRLCEQEGIRNLRVGVVETSLPNAFVFGRRRQPRLAVTRGIIEQLPDNELAAVIAHEVGHLRSRDWLVLSIAYLIPMLLLNVGWRLIIQSGTSKPGAALKVFGALLLCIYWITKLVYLVLSREREFYADAYSARATGNPDSLARALVRIAYGGAAAQANIARILATDDKDGRAARKAAKREAAVMRPVAALAIDSMSPRWMPLTAGSNPFGLIPALMKWDVTNPWSWLHQSQSSHPLTTFRITQLNRFSNEAGLVPTVTVPSSGKRPWRRFLIDLFAYCAPYLGALFSLIVPMAAPFLLGALFRLCYRYGGREREATTAQLIANLQASFMMPNRIRAHGRLETGERYGTTGFVFVDHLGVIPIRISLISIIARLRLPELAGKDIVVSGWYRRASAPWIEPCLIQQLDSNAKIRVRTRFIKALVFLWLVSAFRGHIFG